MQRVTKSPNLPFGFRLSKYFFAFIILSALQQRQHFTDEHKLRRTRPQAQGSLESQRTEHEHARSLCNHVHIHGLSCTADPGNDKGTTIQLADTSPA
jgi:hypothetical protein